MILVYAGGVADTAGGVVVGGATVYGIHRYILPVDWDQRLLKRARGSSRRHTGGGASGSAARGVAGSADDIAQLGGNVVDASQLTVNAAAKNRVFLGHFGGEGMVVGGQRIAAPNAGLQALEGLAGQHGGRTLVGIPGNINALAPAIRGADEIIFNIGAGGIRAGSLTAQELGLIVREGMLGKVKFVTGVTY